MTAAATSVAPNAGCARSGGGAAAAIFGAREALEALSAFIRLVHRPCMLLLYLVLSAIVLYLLLSSKARFALAYLLAKLFRPSRNGRNRRAGRAYVRRW